MTFSKGATTVLETEGARVMQHAFPLKQASLASLHEKLCHRGHPKALHIWPARRPLAACRAVLISTLIPDPGTPQARKEMLVSLGGKVIEVAKKKKSPNGQV